MTPTTRRVVIVVVGFVVLVVALNLIARALDDAVGGNKPGGEPGSTYATSSAGLAGYVKLLAEYDHRVTRLRGELAEANVDPDQTLMIVDPGPMADSDVDAIERFLDDGGRVVLVGVSSGDAREISAGVPRLEFIERRGDVEEFTDNDLGEVAIVTADGGVAYDGAGDTTPLVAEGDIVFATSTRVGPGELVLVAEPSPLENGLLADADNAAFGLEIVGEGRPVAFAEGFHGAASKRGLSALPDGIKIAFIGLGIAAVLFAWASARRIGPPDRPRRELPPARAAYVAALAESLDRTGEPADALFDLAKAAREQAAANAIELTEREAAALSVAPSTTQDVIEVGRAAARINRGDIDERNTP